MTNYEAFTQQHYACVCVCISLKVYPAYYPIVLLCVGRSQRCYWLSPLTGGTESWSHHLSVSSKAWIHCTRSKHTPGMQPTLRGFTQEEKTKYWCQILCEPNVIIIICHAGWIWKYLCHTWHKCYYYLSKSSSKHKKLAYVMLPWSQIHVNLIFFLFYNLGLPVFTTTSQLEQAFSLNAANVNV